MTWKVAVSVALILVAWRVGPASAQSITGSVLPPIPTIEVQGHGETRAKPDTASISVAIETHAKTAEQCGRLNAELSKKVYDALKAELDDKGTVETGAYNLYPEYSQPPVQPRVIGYRAENSITVETSAMNLVGELIDTAVEAGANRINFINFTLRDDAKPRAEAITRASKDAQMRAKVLAASLGVKLKRVYLATTQAERPMPIVMRRSMAAQAAEVAAPTPIEPGEVHVLADVTLIYEIQ
jgi:uncharacterized protein